MDPAQPRLRLTPGQLREMTWGFAPTLIVQAALRNGLFDALEKRDASVEDIGTMTGASVRGVAAILPVLTALGFLERQINGHFSLTHVSRAFLLTSSPYFQGGLLRRANELIQPWLSLSEVVRTGCPETSLNGERDHAMRFDRSARDLFSLNYPAARLLPRLLKIAGTEDLIRVLDVASGAGAWSISVAQMCPHARVTAIDWPEVLPSAHALAKQHGVLGRFTWLPGDFREVDYGSGYQLAILGHILHSEGERRSKVLLRRIYDAMQSGGRIVVAEILVDEDRSGPLLGLLFAVGMLVTTDEGSTYSFAELASWLTDTGFEKPFLLRVPGPSPLIVARRP